MHVDPIHDHLQVTATELSSKVDIAVKWTKQHEDELRVIDPQKFRADIRMVETGSRFGTGKESGLTTRVTTQITEILDSCSSSLLLHLLMRAQVQCKACQVVEPLGAVLALLPIKF